MADQFGDNLQGSRSAAWLDAIPDPYVAKALGLRKIARRDGVRAYKMQRVRDLLNGALGDRPAALPPDVREALQKIMVDQGDDDRACATPYCVWCGALLRDAHSTDCPVGIVCSHFGLEGPTP